MVKYGIIIRNSLKHTLDRIALAANGICCWTHISSTSVLPTGRRGAVRRGTLLDDG